MTTAEPGARVRRSAPVSAPRSLVVGDADAGRRRRTRMNAPGEARRGPTRHDGERLATNCLSSASCRRHSARTGPKGRARPSDGRAGGAVLRSPAHAATAAAVQTPIHRAQRRAPHGFRLLDATKAAIYARSCADCALRALSHAHGSERAPAGKREMRIEASAGPLHSQPQNSLPWTIQVDALPQQALNTRLRLISVSGAPWPPYQARQVRCLSAAAAAPVG